MSTPMTRREFLAWTSATAVGWSVLSRAQGAEQTFRHSLKKAVIVKKPNSKRLEPVKAAGFDGVEAGIVDPDAAARAREEAEALGLRIHSVMRGWAEFNSRDSDKVKRSLDTTVAALRSAQAFGADAILLVPGRLGGMPIPQPWEFRVSFDARTGHLTSVVEGDNKPYARYIDEHNRSYDAFQEAIRQLIPVAKETGVVIAVENVWNNLFVDPHHFACFVDSFQSPHVRVYLDLGNHVKYSPTQEWIRVLGARIVKCHVKDFKLNPDGHGGRFVTIRDGSNDWPAVRRALDDVGYDGWMTIEGSGGISLEERSRRLDLILAGK